MRLYHHQTSGGAEYLTDAFILCPDGHKEGIFKGATIIVRIDGNIRKDAEIIRIPTTPTPEPYPMSRTHTYAELAADYRLWMEYIDPSGIDTPEAWEAMPIERRVEIITGCFGEELTP